ncbi:hypothetical protein GCM10010095_47570 [Streptomyces anthocyanicus]|nr:hypothetical protein JCM4020_44720 [Streptomyces coelicolor]GGL56955.1 hypothetical protein GCM10010095_47570 [Streptomyces anthocyanicus]GHC20493.1 hypothetical protein GCM10010348_51540 [Streptomyces anthocyanicus]
MSRHPAGGWRTRVRLTGRGHTRWLSASAMTARGAVSLSTSTCAWRRTLRTSSPTASTSPPSDGQTGTDTRASPPVGWLHSLGKEGKPLSDQSTRSAVARAKELDLVSPRSGAACLMLPPHLFQKGKGAPVPCRLHQDR